MRTIASIGAVMCVLSLTQQRARRPDPHPAGYGDRRPDDPRREDHRVARHRHPGPLALGTGDPPAGHPGHGDHQRSGRCRPRRQPGTPTAGDRAARPDLAGRVLRHGAGPRLRATGRHRSQGSGQRRPGRAGPEPAADTHQRPRVRILRRGPLPERADRREHRPGHPEPGRDRRGQALRGQQPGEQPLRRQRSRGPTHTARDLPTALPRPRSARPRPAR